MGECALQELARLRVVLLIGLRSLRRFERLAARTQVGAHIPARVVLVGLVQRFRQSAAASVAGVGGNLRLSVSEGQRPGAGIVIPLGLSFDQPARRLAFFVSVFDGDPLSGFPSVESSEADSPVSGG